MQINEPTPDIAKAYPRWRKNRDFLEGEYAVKAAGCRYLPKLHNQSDAEYAKYLLRVPFYPGAARVLEGLKGLIFRKQPHFECPAGMEDIFDTITLAGDTVEDLANELVTETLTTGFTGLLVDYPGFTGAEESVASVVANGLRPYVHLYRAESILEATPGVVSNRQMLVHVRLLEDDEHVLQLRLDNGVYTATRHTLIDNTWVPGETVKPLKAGKPLTEIPFVLVTTKARTFAPIKGPLDDLVNVNASLYLEQADAKNSRFYSSAPILTIIGAEQRDLTITPGTILWFPETSTEKPVTVEFTEFSGAGQDTLEKAVQTFKDEMASIGLRMLAAEKADAEAAETLARKQAGENATLQAWARNWSRPLERSLNTASEWHGGGEVRFELSTDFVPIPMSAQDRAQALAEYQAGIVSLETLWDQLIAGEVLPETFDPDDERTRLAATAMEADRPTQDLPGDDQPQPE